jgi:hemerythrin superfamily protein
MDAIALLNADHNRLRGLFARFHAAKKSDDVTMMTEVAGSIAHELEVHTTIEEEVFYPWAHDLSEEIAEVVDEGVQEHHVVKTLLGEVAGLEPGSDEWVAKHAVIIENVEHHAEEEESEMFPSIRGATESNALEEMGRRLEARKASLGAPVLEDKIDLTTGALRELAKEQQIPGRSKMNHDELAATVAPK